MTTGTLRSALIEKLKMIEIIVKSNGFEDLVVVRQGENELFSGYRITSLELSSILEQLGHETDIISVYNTQLEEGLF